MRPVKRTHCVRFGKRGKESVAPFPMTRVNWPAMSPSGTGVAEGSPSQGGGLWAGKPSGVSSLSAAATLASEDICAALDTL